MCGHGAGHTASGGPTIGASWGGRPGSPAAEGRPPPTYLSSGRPELRKPAAAALLCFCACGKDRRRTKGYVRDLCPSLSSNKKRIPKSNRSRIFTRCCAVPPPPARGAAPPPPDPRVFFCLHCFLFKPPSIGDNITKKGFKNWKKVVEIFNAHVGGPNNAHNNARRLV